MPLYAHGMLVSTMGSASFMKPNALILTARKLHLSWEIRFSSCPVIGRLYFPTVSPGLSSQFFRDAFTVQENYAACDDSDGDRYTEDGSESGDEQYGVPWIVNL
jgi:hypothetical protein